LKQKQEDAANNTDSDSDEDDPDKEKVGTRDGTDPSFVNTSKDPRVRTTIANLRIREDTAKYLRNLDPNSAVYDGKSRIMKENPNPNIPLDQQTFKGDA
jgi:pre-mRNA-processing factor SLU7